MIYEYYTMPCYAKLRGTIPRSRGDFSEILSLLTLGSRMDLNK